MDKLGYILGDLVMTNGAPLGTEQDVVYRVTSSDPSKTLKLDDGTVMKGVVRLENLEGVEFGDKGYLFGDCCAWVKDIVPIPVTSEILKKNGWKKEMYLDWRYYIPLERTLLYISIGVDRDRDGAFAVCVGLNMSHIAYISFVHQLQHLFFSLNINYEREV